MSKKTLIFLVSGLIISSGFIVAQAAPTFQSGATIASTSAITFLGAPSRFLDRTNYDGNAATATYAATAGSATNASNADTVDAYHLNQDIRTTASPSFNILTATGGLRVSAGNVGVGIASPDFKLDVQGGQINASGGLCIAGVCQTSWLGLGGGGGGGGVWATSSTHIYNINTGNVGVGTAAPAAKLDVVGAIKASGSYWVGNGQSIKTGVLGSSVYFDVGNLYVRNGNATGDGKIGIAGSMSIGNSYWNVASPSDGLIVQGNVGIGTTTPTAAKLTIVPASGYAISAGGFKIGDVALPTISTDAVTKGYMDSAIASATSTLHNPVTLAAVGSAPNANGMTLNTQVLNLQPASASFPGVVTTGVQTFAGVKTFSSQITGSISGNAGTATALAANGTNCSAGSYPLGVDAGGNAESCTAVSGSLPSGTTGQTLRHNGTTWVADSNLFNNGSNVGIGTTAPNSPLEISKQTTWGNMNNPIININNSGTGGDINQLHNMGSITWQSGSTPTAAISAIRNTPASGNNVELRFTTASAGTQYERMTITSTGNVGIGTTNPSQKLEVNGSLAFTVANPSIISSSYVIMPGGLHVSGGTPYFTNQAQFRGGVHNDTAAYLTVAGGTGGVTYFSGNVGIGTTTPNQKLSIDGNAIAVAYYYSSDRNLKSNIKTIDNALAKILKLRGVTFRWKETGQASVGLIAQEIEKVFPELVTGPEGGKSVSYGNLVAPLIEAIKEQQKEIDRLEVKVKVLEDRK